VLLAEIVIKVLGLPLALRPRASDRFSPKKSEGGRRLYSFVLKCAQNLLLIVEMSEGPKFGAHRVRLLLHGQESVGTRAVPQ
jgi:hypothetical protein